MGNKILVNSLLLVLTAIPGCASAPQTTVAVPVIATPRSAPTLATQPNTIASNATIPKQPVPNPSQPLRPNEPRSVPYSPPAVTKPEPSRVLKPASNYYERGMASWYGLNSHGAKTANGELYDLYGMTAAHAQLPFATRVKVTNPHNGRSIMVKINDRLTDNRVLIQLSYEAAKRLGLTEKTASIVEISAP